MNSKDPTVCFTIIEPQNRSINEFYAAQNVDRRILKLVSKKVFDPTFRNINSLKSVDQRVLCRSKTSINQF